MIAWDSILIHHSAGIDTGKLDAAGIFKYHTDPKPKGKGWAAIGYHWIIDGEAILYVGRQIPATGAHAPPNSGRLGVCVIGDNTDPKECWTGEQVVMLKQVIEAVGLLMPWIAVVDGHRDIMPGHTVCPGLNVRNLLDL